MLFFVCSVSCLLFHSSILSVRKMLYQIYDDMLEENFDKMKFLLTSKLGRRKIEACNVSTHTYFQKAILQKILTFTAPVVIFLWLPYHNKALVNTIITTSVLFIADCAGFVRCNGKGRYSVGEQAP